MELVPLWQKLQTMVTNILQVKHHKEIMGSTVSLLLGAALAAVLGLLLLRTTGTEIAKRYIFGHRGLLSPLSFGQYRHVRHPEKYSLPNAQNVYIGGQEGKIGAWYAKATGVESATILLLHGSGITRAESNNVDIVKKLTHLGCNVLSIDYRGFGDSDGSPTCIGVVDDSVRCFKWLLEVEKAKHLPHLIYGKRLGAVIAIETAAILCKDEIPISAVIIDGGFDSYRNYGKTIASYRWIHMVPFVSQSIQEIEKGLDALPRITKVKCDVLFLHSCGDKVVPSYYSHRLFEMFVDSNKYYRAKFVMFEKNYDCNHIMQSARYEASITDFIKLAKPVFPGYQFFISIRNGLLKFLKMVQQLVDGWFFVFAKNWNLPLSGVASKWVSMVESVLERNGSWELFVTSAREFLSRVNWNQLGKTIGRTFGELTKTLVSAEGLLPEGVPQELLDVVESLKEALGKAVDP